MSHYQGCLPHSSKSQSLSLSWSPFRLRTDTQALDATTVELPSPSGKWKTIDDRTGKITGIVVFREDHGQVSGTIETILDPPVPNPTCYLCSGALKDQPLVGMRVLWGFKRNGNQWTGGQVLDPETGKVYRALFALEDGGNKLRLRGYVGMPIFGRTQHWLRVE